MHTGIQPISQTDSLLTLPSGWIVWLDPVSLVLPSALHHVWLSLLSDKSPIDIRIAARVKLRLLIWLRLHANVFDATVRTKREG